MWSRSKLDRTYSLSRSAVPARVVLEYGMSRQLSTLTRNAVRYHLMAANLWAASSALARLLKAEMRK
jgi:hypothetical protein